jgi:hypothetical protein
MANVQLKARDRTQFSPLLLSLLPNVERVWGGVGKPKILLSVGQNKIDGDDNADDMQ